MPKLNHQCSTCGYRCATESVLYAHSKIHDPFRCPGCPFTSRFESALQRHAKTHGKGFKAFPCNKCDMAYTSVRCLRDHIAAKHAGKNRELECKICGFIAASAVLLEQHTLAHAQKDDNKDLRCAVCTHTETSLHALIRHMLTHIPPKFQCSACHKRFQFPSALAKHRAYSHPVIPPTHPVIPPTRPVMYEMPPSMGLPSEGVDLPNI